MADNITLNSGSGGSTMRTDDDGTAHWQYVKLAFGADNTQTIVGSTSSNPLPVALSDTDNTVLDNIQTAVEVIDDSVASEGGSLGKGILLQGDDGTDRKNINVDATTGDVQVDVTNTVTADVTGQGDVPITLAGEVVSIDDNSGSITVDGTVTANLSTTDNTVLDNIQTAVEIIDNAISGSEMQVDVVAALPTGSNAIGKLAANSGVDIGDVDVTSISAGSNLIGDVGISGARTSGGTTSYRNIDVDETEDEVKGSAGQVYWIHCVTIDATPVYLHIYNATSANVTVGTTTPDHTFLVPSSGDANGAGFTLSIPNGIEFDTAITVAATTTVGGSSGPGANECILNMGYA